MLRLVALAAAMVVGATTLDLRSVHASVDVDGGVPRTARAVRAALAKHALDGHVWLGKLRGAGGRRDTLIYVPRTLDPTRTIELVVYMEGHGSFGDAAMEHRHAASIARLRGNTIYVAPDAPSSAHGSPKARTPYWQPGCAIRRCAGGHAAPGDFLVFLAEVRTRIAAIVEHDADALDLRLSLIGFSNGGKGVVNALAQLAAVDFTVGAHAVRLGDVIFADGNYGHRALDDAWAVLAARPEAPRLTILVGDGAFAGGADPAAGNRQRAAAFWRRAAADASPPARGRATRSGRLRIVPLRGGHHAIGDVAIDFLADPREPVATTP